MPCKGFCGGNRRKIVTKDTPYSSALGGIVIGRPGAVGIDIIYGRYIQPRHLKGLFHCKESPLPVKRRSRLVESVAGIAPAAKNRYGFNPAPERAFLRFKHKIRRALAKIKACPCGVKRPAGLLIQDHKRIEAVEMIGRQTLAAPAHHPLELPAPDKIGPIDNGICGR